jgi:hypothetical protein
MKKKDMLRFMKKDVDAIRQQGMQVYTVHRSGCFLILGFQSDEEAAASGPLNRGTICITNQETGKVVYKGGLGYEN